MELNEIRAQIDEINREMLDLFEKRMRLSAQVASYKKEHDLPVFVPAREVAILNSMRQKASPELQDYDVKFFQSLLQISREYQSDLLSLTEVSCPLPSEIHTDRLILKPLNRLAAPAVFSLTSDPEVARYMRFPVHTKVEQAEALIDEMTSGCNLSFLVLKKNAEFIGLFSFMPDPEKPNEIGLRIFLGREHWGNGYCSELNEMAKDFAQKFFRATCLRAHVVSKNTASCHVLEKGGFICEKEYTFPDLEGALRVYRYDIVSE